jgi:hypothetical protein
VDVTGGAESRQLGPFHGVDHAYDADVRGFVEEIVRTGLLLSDLLSRLLDDLPEDAFPGEDRVEVLLEMLTGTVFPAASAAGPATVRQARALLGAVSDRVIEDLRAAVDLASRG